MWLEGRVYLESLKLIRDPVFRGVDVPSGLRKPVLLVPGFLAGDWTLRTLFDWLKRVDYRPRMAGVAFNVTYSEVMLRPLIDALVEQVITLGSPLGDPFDIHPLTMAGVRAAQLYNTVRYRHRASVEMRFLRDLAAEPRVPTTSIYSRSDGVVNWQACLRSDINAIEVRGSHIGLALNPEVYRILAHLLPAPWRHN
jgi:hypothetical protein